MSAGDTGNRPRKGQNVARRVVYFIQAGQHGPIKIGVASNVRKRLAALQTGHHTSLRIIGTVPGDAALERELHQRFAAHRIRGEWFKAACATEVREFCGKRRNGRNRPRIDRDFMRRALDCVRDVGNEGAVAINIFGPEPTPESRAIVRARHEALCRSIFDRHGVQVPNDASASEYMDMLWRRSYAWERLLLRDHQEAA